jgi:hypothetical protein
MRGRMRVNMRLISNTLSDIALLRSAAVFTIRKYSGIMKKHIYLVHSDTEKDRNQGGDLEMKEKFGYVIKVDGKVVWEGRNPKEKYFEIREQNPGKEIAIAWRTTEKILVC